MTASFKKRLAGPGYVILNGIRVINIIAFLDIIAASAVMLVQIKLLSGFFFFQAVTHAVIAGVSLFLIISELPICRNYFDENWPLLGENSGFFTLAAVMFMLGCGILSNLNHKEMAQYWLGMTFWRIVLSAGILGLVMGAINAIATFLFTDRESGVSARQVRQYGAVASQKVISRSNSRRSFMLGTKRDDVLPMYTSSQPMRRSSSTRQTTRFPLKLSSPEPSITAPDLAHHPALHSGHG